MTTGTKALPGLEHGQLWKTEKGYIQIWHIGKRLIEYKNEGAGNEGGEDADDSN